MFVYGKVYVSLGVYAGVFQNFNLRQVKLMQLHTQKVRVHVFTEINQWDVPPLLIGYTL